MRTYQYRARNLSGQVVEGTLRANDDNHAYELLEKDRMLPIAIRPVMSSRIADLFRPKIKERELIAFTRQLSTLLRAGVPIIQALVVLRQQTEDAALKKTLVTIERSISGGSRLSEALGDCPSIFSTEYVSIVVSGESGGDMVRSLANLADWMESELEFKTAVKSALRYPLSVVVALCGAAILTVLVVIPKFALFFANSTVPLPLPTRILMGTQACLVHYWPWVITFVVALVVGIRAALKVPVVRMRFDQIKFYLPIFGPLYRKIVITRFVRVFGMLVRGGVSVTKTLEIASRIVANTYFRQALANVIRLIQGGSSIAEGFRLLPVVPPMMASLIAIGEKTGSLDEMLDHLGNQYNVEINYALKNLTTMIEPIITVIIGIGALFLALAIFMPIWNMSQTLRH